VVTTGGVGREVQGVKKFSLYIRRCNSHRQVILTYVIFLLEFNQTVIKFKRFHSLFSFLVTYKFLVRVFLFAVCLSVLRFFR